MLPLIWIVKRWIFFPKDELEKKGAGKGMFSMFKGLVGSKALTKEDLEPVISKLRDNLIDKVRFTLVCHQSIL